MDKKKIDRINELYKLKKTVGLTEEEANEQAELRKEYLAFMRGNFVQQMDNISIQEKDGTITPLSKKNVH